VRGHKNWGAAKALSFIPALYSIVSRSEPKLKRSERPMLDPDTELSEALLQCALLHKVLLQTVAVLRRQGDERHLAQAQKLVTELSGASEMARERLERAKNIWLASRSQPPTTLQ
jgi:hypothetical protein